MDPAEIEEVELQLFIRALKLRHGYDFSQYAPASFKRRVQNLASATGARNISELTGRLIHDEGFLPQVIEKLSVPVSEMFREPVTFKLLRDEVLPQLASYPHINVWQAGCAHGEEVYSAAIMLLEAGLFARTQIYATDISDAALARAHEGIYSARELQLYQDNYRRAGGSAQLSDYFTGGYDLLKMRDELRAGITFANHNLVADGVFGEMHLILCRNVLIYFNDQLQERVLRLFRDSLVRSGFLAVGSRESLAFSAVAHDFHAVRKGVPLYQLRRRGE
ncbi:MAG TPA: protein-glutamate O-methyltransferase CheR [Solimonas sp.]|nr:protein-glutamate O-methyltransferase CheR [Solimonas sp.]